MCKDWKLNKKQAEFLLKECAIRSATAPLWPRVSLASTPHRDRACPCGVSTSQSPSPSPCVVIAIDRTAYEYP